MRVSRLAQPPLLLLAVVSACAKGPQAAADAGQTGNTAATDPIGSGPEQMLATPPVVQNTDDPAGFVPLQSQPVKDAIYRAMKTGRIQRWQDGKLSGYAVPSATTAANGCRAVRYTVDQRPEVPFESINACSASR